MPISGIEGFVTIDGATFTFAEWEFSKKCAIVDRSHFATGGEPSNARGQRTGTLTLEGPLELAIGLVDGNVYVFVCGVTTGLAAQITARVSEITPSNKHTDGPRFRVTAEQIGVAILP